MNRECVIERSARIRTLTCRTAATTMLAAAQWCQAAEFSWGFSTGNWSSNSNWLGGVAPAGTDVSDRLNFGEGSGGYAATLDPSLPQPFQVGAITLQAGSGSILIDGGGIEFGGAAPQLLNHSTSAGMSLRIQNPLTLSMPAEFGGDGAAVLDIAGDIGGSGSFRKTGAGAVMLSGANTFDGGVDFESGEIIINNPAGLRMPDISSFGAGTVRLKPGEQTLSSAADNNPVNNATVFVGLGATRFTKNFTFTAAEVFLDNLNNTIQRNLNVDTGKTVQFDGVIRNTMASAGTHTGMSKSGGGTLIFASAHTFAAVSNFAPPSFSMNAGTLVIRADSTTNMAGDSITASPFGRQRLQLGGGTIVADGAGDKRVIHNGLVFSGNDITFAGKTLQLNGDGVLLNNRTIRTLNQTEMFGSITQTNGAAGFGITKAGAGTLAFFKGNTYRGDTLINEGVLAVVADKALGNGGGTRGKTVVADGATLQLAGVNYLDAEPLEISGTGAGGLGGGGGIGAIFANELNSTFGGVTTLKADSRIGVALGKKLTFTNDVIKGDFRLNAGIKIGGEFKFAKGLKKAAGDPLGAGDNVVEPLVIEEGGRVTLEDLSDYDGDTDVQNGMLYVNGILAAGAGNVSVELGSVIGGIGSVGRNVSVADMAELSPGDELGTLTLQSVALSPLSSVEYDLGVPAQSNDDFVATQSMLVLDGVLNVTDIGGFQPGLYPLMSYGALTDNGLTVGSLPGGLNGTIQIDPLARTVNLNVVPEPSLFAALGSALLLARRRRT